MGRYRTGHGQDKDATIIPWPIESLRNAVELRFGQSLLDTDTASDDTFHNRDKDLLCDRLMDLYIAVHG